LIFAILPAAHAENFSIPTESVEAQKIYFGTAKSFAKPGTVDYEALIKATPEFDEVRKKKVQQGTGKFWILYSQASDRVVRAISEVGTASDFDFIAAQGYLEGLQPPIQSEDITSLVLEHINMNKQDRKR
jgi:hypothetical protein